MRSLFPLLLLAAMVLTAGSLPAQTLSTAGTEFWLGYLENRPVNDESRFALLLSSEVNTTGSVTIPRTGLSIPFTLAADRPLRLELPRAAFNASGSEQVEDKGLLIVAEDSITVAAVHYKTFFSDASGVLPVSQLGNSYVVIAAEDDAQNISPSALVVVATEDDTEIEIVTPVITQGLRPAGVPFKVTMERGQVYQLKAMGDLTGTRIRSISREPFALFAGAQAAAVECTDDSHLYDQLYPVSAWEFRHVVIPFRGKTGDIVKVVAAEDSTIVRFDCGRQVRLNRGESYDTLISRAVLITSTRPVSVGQLARGQGCSGRGGPSMLAVMPMGRVLHRRLFYSDDRLNPTNNNQPFFSDHYLNVLVKSAHTGLVMLDSAPVPATEFRPLPGDRAWSYAQIRLDPGPHILRCDSGAVAHAYGFGDYDAYTYALGYDAPATPLAEDTVGLRIRIAGASRMAEITACSPTGEVMICSGRAMTFVADTGIYPGEWYWDLGDGTTATGGTVRHSYPQPGTYRVKLTLIGGECRTYTAIRDLALGDCGGIVAPRISVAPNPVRGKTMLRYQLFEESEVRVELFDARGERLDLIAEGRHRSGEYMLPYDLSDRPSGTYLVRFSINGRQTVERLTIYDGLVA